MSISFDQLRRANMARLPQFKNSLGARSHLMPDGSDWSPAQWLQALVGELGEYANKRKKFERGDIDFDEFMTEACKELADVQIYLDLLAFRLQINLGIATLEKFNEVSRRIGVDVFLGPPTPEKVVPMRGTMDQDEVNVSLFDECKRLERGLLGMKPMEDVPKDGTYIILFAESGYTGTPHRCEICHWDEEYRPMQPWVNHAGDSFTDGGGRPVGWLPLPS